jgi:sugar phosphate isomerase/epimerase
MKLACALFSFTLLTPEESGKLLKLLGFRYADLGTQVDRPVGVPGPAIEENPSKVAERLKRLAGENELMYTDMLSFFDQPANSPDPKARAANARRLAAYLELCRRAAIPGLTLLPGVLWPDLGFERSYDLARAELTSFTAMAGEAGVRLSIEAHYESIVEDPAQACRLFKEVPGLKATLDYSHYVVAGRDPATVHQLIPYTAHFHARQAKPGQMQAIWEDGTIDFRDVVGRLRAAGYEGFYCVEYVHTPRWNNNRLDVLSETIRMRDLLRELLAD